MWDLIVSVPDHCLPFYFIGRINQNLIVPAALDVHSAPP